MWETDSEQVLEGKMKSNLERMLKDLKPLRRKRQRRIVLEGAEPELRRRGVLRVRPDGAPTPQRHGRKSLRWNLAKVGGVGARGAKCDPVKMVFTDSSCNTNQGV